MSLFFSATGNKKVTGQIPIFGDGGRTFAGVISGSTAYSWGSNLNGQLGDNTVVAKSTPIAVLGTTKTFCKISFGVLFSYGVDKNGKGWAWGANDVGQSGDNTIVSKLTPVAIAGATKTFCNIIGGNDHALGLDKNGKVWAWGGNTYGQLGDNSVTSKLTPVAILGATKTFCKIYAGELHSAGLDKNGRAWTWGYNFIGGLGDNSLVSKRTPISVLGTVKTFCEIVASLYHTLAIDKNGKGWAWGTNSSGQLGDGTTTASRLTPVAIAGATKTFCKIAGGEATGYGLDKNGKIWAWGYGFYGERGDGLSGVGGICTTTPVAVAGAAKTFCEIFAGAENAYAIDKNGKLWAWGRNSNGEVGDNTIVSRTTPVRVCRL